MEDMSDDLARHHLEIDRQNAMLEFYGKQQEETLKEYEVSMIVPTSLLHF